MFMIVQLETKEEKTIKINKIKKINNLYQVFFSNELTLLVDENHLFEYSLYLNTEIRAEVIEILKNKQEYFQVLDRALQKVNQRAYTIKQLRDRLLLENYDLDNVNIVINELIVAKILNDDLYYEDYVNFKTQQGYGPLYIKNKLHLLGIDREVYFSSEQQLKILKNKASKLKLNKDIALIKKSFKSKMKNQGFDVTIIDEVLADLIYEKDDTYLKKDYEKFFNKYYNKYDEKQLFYVIKRKLLEKGYEIEDIELILKGMI